MSYIQEEFFRVIVKPNAKKNEILSFDDVRKAYKLSIKEPPEDNKANIELIKFLSKEMGKRVKIVSGHTSKVKSLRVQ